MSEKFAVRASTGMADYSKNMSLANAAEMAEKILGFDGTSSFNTDFVSTMWYSPELMPDVWQMAKSQNELRKFVRFFYNTDPYIHSIVNMHARYPLSKFQIVSSDEKVTKFYEKSSINRNFNINHLLDDIMLAYCKLGHVVLMGVPKTQEYSGFSTFQWENFIPFEPEVVNVYKNALENKEYYTLLLTPDLKDDIKKAQSFGKPINPMLLEAFESGKNEYLLDETYMSKIINKTDVSAVVGTSPLQCLIRTLMFQDKVNMLKVTAIDRYRYPMEIWKVGDYANDVACDATMLDDLEKAVKSAKANAPFALFVPSYVNFDVAGYSSQSQSFSYKEDYEFIRDSILVGLGVSKDLILGEAKGWASSTKQLTLQKALMMYQHQRQKIEDWLINQFYYPLAEKNDFINAEGDLNLPQIVWEKDLSTDRNTPDEYMKLWEKGLISTKTLFSMYKNLDYKQEAELLIDEIDSGYDDGKRIRNRKPKPLGDDAKKEETDIGDNKPSKEEALSNEPGEATKEDMAELDVEQVEAPSEATEEVPAEETTPETADTGTE